jgi:hypothetical protein
MVDDNKLERGLLLVEIEEAEAIQRWMLDNLYDFRLTPLEWKKETSATERKTRSIIKR